MTNKAFIEPISQRLFAGSRERQLITLCRAVWLHGLQGGGIDKWYWFDGVRMMVTNVWYEYKDNWFYLVRMALW